MFNTQSKKKKNDFRKSDERGFLAQVSRQIRITDNCKKACVAVLLRFIHIMTALMVQHLINSLLEYKRLMTYKNLDFDADKPMQY